MADLRLEAARSICAAVLIHPSVMVKAMDLGLEPRHFPGAKLATVYRYARWLYDNGDDVSTLTVQALIEKAARRGKVPFTVDEVASFMHELQIESFSVGAFPGAVRLLLEEADWELARKGYVITGEAIEARNWTDYFNAIAVSEKIGQTGRADERLDSAALVDGVVRWKKEPKHGIPLPFNALTEKMAGGFKPGDTTVLGGWTRMGKTILCGQLSLHAAMKGYRVWEFVNEMSWQDRIMRMLARESGVAFKSIVRDQLSDYETDKVRKAMDSIRSMPYGVTMCPGWTAEKIARAIRREKADLTIVDMATRIPTRKGDVAEWDRISGVMADVARQTGTHVLLTCQLNASRNTSEKAPPPTLRDLRNTSSWGNDARNVIFVHRHQEELSKGVYKPTEDGIVQLAKCSNGEEWVQHVHLNEMRMTFTAVEPV